MMQLVCSVRAEGTNKQSSSDIREFTTVCLKIACCSMRFVTVFPMFSLGFESVVSVCTRDACLFIFYVINSEMEVHVAYYVT